jgi:outer membrane protein assembly factor BamB
MLLVTRVDSRRVFVLGVAGLIPAALVTLLLVHQPSVGGRRLYPMLRGSLAVIGLALALATVIAWTTAPNRFSRSSLSGLAWAGVTALLCIGPLLESSPRARLFALDLRQGHVVWARSGGGTSPVVVDDDLVVTDVDAGTLVGIDRLTGRERWRRRIVDAGEDARAARAVAAGAASPTTMPRLDRQLSDTVVRAGEHVVAVARAGDATYVYVSTPGATGTEEGSVVKVEDGAVRWTKALPIELVVQGAAPSMVANSDSVVIAGGEEIGVIEAVDGTMRWRLPVANLAKSRGYTLPGSARQVAIDDSAVYLSATPER